MKKYSMQFTKKNLYRKVNTKTRWVHHNFWWDYKYSRNKKRETIEQVKWTMHGKHRRGLDYTPLFKFLLKKVWYNWDEIYSEAVSRLDKSDPIFWLVAINDADKKDFVRVWESSYYSWMFVDKDWILQLTNSNLKPEDIWLLCSCCTHTLNWEAFK